MSAIKQGELPFQRGRTESHRKKKTTTTREQSECVTIAQKDWGQGGKHGAASGVLVVSPLGLRRRHGLQRGVRGIWTLTTHARSLCCSLHRWCGEAKWPCTVGGCVASSEGLNRGSRLIPSQSPPWWKKNGLGVSAAGCVCGRLLVFFLLPSLLQPIHWRCMHCLASHPFSSACHRSKSLSSALPKQLMR